MRPVPILAFLLFCPLAFGQQDVGTTSFSSAVGSNAVAPSMTNTAGNFLFSYGWIKCSSTNPNSSNVYTASDSKGNTWNVNRDSSSTFSSTTRAMYFFWTPASIAGGANVVTYTNVASDCQILGGIQNEYTGLVAWNTGSYRVNGNFMPFTTPDSNTTFPVNANATYLAPSNTSNNLVYVCAIHEGNSTGTWSGSTGLTQVNSMINTNFQMACYDGTATTTGAGGPSALSIGNTSGTVTLALGEWNIFNRTTLPSSQTPVSASCVGNPTAICSVFVPSGSFLILDWTESATGSFTTNTCGTVEDAHEGNLPGNRFGSAVLRSTNTGPCTIARTPASGQETMTVTMWAPGVITGDNSSIAFQYLNQADVSFSGGSPIVPYTPISDTYSTILYTSAHSASGGTSLPSFACTNGSVVANAYANSLTVVACSAGGLSPGAQAQSMSWTGGRNQVSYVEYLLRTSRPSFGHIQTTECTPTACGPMFTPTAGDTLLVEAQENSSIACAISNSGSLTMLSQPGVTMNNTTWRIDNVPATPITFTIGTCPIDTFMVTEVAGLAHTEPLYDAANNYNDNCHFGGTVGCPTTTWPSTPVHILKAGQYYLYSGITQIQDITVTCDTGYIPRAVDGVTGASVNLVCDRVLTTSGSQSVNSTFTWGTAAFTMGASLLAYGPLTNTGPHVWQTVESSFTSSPFTQSTRNATTAGNDLWISVTGGAALPITAATWGLSTTCGGTINLARGGGATDVFAVWDVHNITGGSTCNYTVSTNRIGSRASVILAEVGPISAVQAGNSVQALGLSVSTGSVTTSNPTTIFGYWMGCSPDLTASFLYNVTSGPTQVQDAYQDNVSWYFYSKTDLAPATESASATCGGGNQSIGAIVPFTLSPITASAQPFVNLITQNNPEHYLGEWRK